MSQGSKSNWRPTASLEALKNRARMLQGIRAFFAEREVLEVETPSMSRSTITDPHLHSFQTRFAGQVLYLQTSPEFFMKRLLASGSGDIYQVARVFRDDESGSWHNPEFSLLEWYRLGLDHHQLMDEIDQLLSYLRQQLGSRLRVRDASRLSYQQAFIETLDIDPLACTPEQLQQKTARLGIEIPVGMVMDDKDMWLDWLITQAVAPAFPSDSFTFIYDYPVSQAALARVSEQDGRVAHRFELFYGELELANGFYELVDANEQRHRFEQENFRRLALGLSEIPLDEHLLTALAQGMPECSGVAIGLDRLLMVLLEKSHISEVLGFPLDRV
ncbi:MAG: EF-P lysine aminoacylase EpmA [Gammaproteobacteria bacterium]|nr:EF-P lysine aminoacylase EpmA [Gammaproteobacteria bacterium]